MEMIQPYLPYVYAVLGIAAVLLVLTFVLRSFKTRARGRKGMRLGIVEYCEVDESRRLVLLRRDGVEHLVLIGGNQDLLVETGIGENYADEAAPEPQLSVPDEVLPFRAPRAPVFGAKRPILRSVNPDDNGQEPA